MNAHILTSKIIAPFLFESGVGSTVLLPGGFKPPHGGHLHIANQYAINPTIKQVLIMVGPSARDGIGQEQSLKIWEMLPKNPKIQVVSSKFPSPILSAYDYVFTLPQDSDETVILGASSKDGDQKRSVEFVDNVNGKYKEVGTKAGIKTPPNVVAKTMEPPSPIVYSGRSDSQNGQPISATILRQDILEKNYQNFASNYPNVAPEIIKELYSYLVGGLTEVYKMPVKSISSTSKNPMIDLALEYNPEALKYFNKVRDAVILLKFPSDNTAIKVKKTGTTSSGKVELDIVDASESDKLNPSQIIDMKDVNYERWLSKFYSQNKWISGVIGSMNEVLLKEGGNIFDGTTSIPKNYVKATLKHFIRQLKSLYPELLKELTLLGSVGKKDMSGDIDMAVDSSIFFDENGEPKLDEWNIDPQLYNDLLAQNTKRARTAKPEQLKLRTLIKLIGDSIQTNLEDVDVDIKGAGSGMISFKIRQYDENEQPTDQFVQADLMLGDIEWLKFSYYSDVYAGNVKGLHRTQLIVALFSAKGYTFSHNYGIKNKDTQEIEASRPDEALALLNKLYNTNITPDIVNNYFKLIEYLKNNITKEELEAALDSYMRILDSTRADIPDDLKDYWIANKERLGLKGKFLPDDSSLKQYITESGAAGGERIQHTVISDLLRKYEKNVLSNYKNYISFRETGGTKREKYDHGDIDLILTVKGVNKVVSKREFAEYVSKLPDSIIAPFRSEKYKGKKYYIAGELVTVLFNYDGLYVQIDNNISFSDEETNFKGWFLDLPAEKQGLISALVKVATAEEPYQKIFDRLSIPTMDELNPGERYEFTVSGQKLTLRHVILDENNREKSRTDVWSTTNLEDVQTLLNKYDFSMSFDDMLKQAKRLLSPNSKNRVKGIFKSIVSVSTGEIGTEKGKNKEEVIRKVESL